MKVNETHDYAVCKKIKVMHYFGFAAEGLIFFLLISISSGVRGGGAAAPPAWKIQGKICFQGKLKLLKNPEG